MSIGSDSRVVDALQNPMNLERVLRALGCDTHKENGAPFDSPHGFIHCPMPDHQDRNESCSVIPHGGFLECRSRCGTIRPLDLIIQHGQASDRGGAAKWVEKELGIEQDRPEHGTPRRHITDPSLSVRQYLALKHLSNDTIKRFGLVDVGIWQSTEKDRKGFFCEFTADYYGAVLMPNDPPEHDHSQPIFKPRVRDIFGARWPATVLHATRGEAGTAQGTTKVACNERLETGATDHYDRPILEARYPQRLYGISQFHALPADHLLARVAFLVEGESDVHAQHDMGLPNTLGLPGVGAYRSNAGDLIDTIQRHAAVEGSSLADWTVAVWSEPGAAGAKLPEQVAGAVTTYCAEQELAAPRVAALLHNAIPAIPTSTAPGAPAAHAKDPCDIVARLVPLHRGNAAAARAQAGQLFTDGAFIALGQSTPALDPAAPAVAIAPAQAPLPPVTDLKLKEDPWEGMDSKGHLPTPPVTFCPRSLKHLGAQFMRTASGWAELSKDKEGDEKMSPVSSIFYVGEVLDIGGIDHAVLRAPRRHSQEFADIRISRADLADARKVHSSLGSIGASVARGKSAQCVALVQALIEEWLKVNPIIVLPPTTGWGSSVGTGPFGGIESEPLNMFGKWMFEANQMRRAKGEAAGLTVAQQARKWWDEGVLPLLSDPTNPGPSSAAPLLSLGAAAAGPLVGPLELLGIESAPVVWLAGLGGGGKTTTQRLCASIFAPKIGSLNGIGAFYTSANITQAAIMARVDSCMDLPLILDDIMQLPPQSGSTSRGDDAKIEHAASLGMMIFNRDSIERATRDGGTRLTRRFRSTAILSGEVSMSSEMSRAIVSAGHRRRISCIEAKPMHDRGLPGSYAEHVNVLLRTVGGAAGELLVAEIRELWRTRETLDRYKQVRKAIAELDSDRKVTNTQRESLSVNLLGFLLLAQVAGGWEFNAGLERACVLLKPYVDAGAGEGGATREDDLASPQRVIEAVKEMMRSHGARFDRTNASANIYSPIPNQGFLGKVLRRYKHSDDERVVLYRDGILLLQGRYGITQQILEQAKSAGVTTANHRYRDDSGDLARGYMIRLPQEHGEEDQDDPTPGHDTDPNSLAVTLHSRGQVHVPGASGAAAATVASDERVWQDIPPHEEEPEMLVDYMGIRIELGEQIQRKLDGMADPLARAQMTTIQSQWILMDHVAKMGGVERAKFIIESATNAMLHSYQTGVGHRTITYQEGNMGKVKGMRFLWGAHGGFYALADATNQLADEGTREAVYAAIRTDVGKELAALREFYVKAAESDPEQQLGEPIVVADLPAAGSENWARIEALGWEVLRGQWLSQLEALQAASHSPDAATQRAYHELRVKHERVHLMARWLRPDWFIVDEASLAAPA